MLTNVSPELRDISAVVCSMYSCLDLSQLFPIHPLKGYSLDLLFASPSTTSLIDSEDYLVRAGVHHTPTFFKFLLYDRSIADVIVPRSDFLRADYLSINNVLNTINWGNLSDSVDVSNRLEQFNKALYGIIDNFVHAKRCSESTYPAWYSSDLKRLVIDKKRVHVKWKSTRNLSDYIDFKRLRALCIRTSKLCYKEYIANIELSLTRNIKQFWAHVNRCRKASGVPLNVTWEDRVVSSDQEVVDLFPDYFGSVLLSVLSPYPQG